MNGGVLVEAFDEVMEALWLDKIQIVAVRRAMATAEIMRQSRSPTTRRNSV